MIPLRFSSSSGLRFVCVSGVDMPPAGSWSIFVGCHDFFYMSVKREPPVLTYMVQLRWIRLRRLIYIPNCIG